MKINLTENLRKNSMVGNIILHSIANSLKDKIIIKTFSEKYKNNEGDLIVDLKLIMNDDIELDSYDGNIILNPKYTGNVLFSQKGVIFDAGLPTWNASDVTTGELTVDEEGYLRMG